MTNNPFYGNVSVKKWQEEKKFESLGMPHFIANGSHILGDTRYRFLVLPRYDTDLQKLSRTMNYGRIHPRNVLILAAQILDVLEYLHAKGYTHSDIKSSNLMVGFDGAQFKDQRTCRYMLPTTLEGDDVNGYNSTAIDQSISDSPKKSHGKSSTRCSSYYEDEDFDLTNYSDSSDFAESDAGENSPKKSGRTTRRAKNSCTPKTPRNKKVFNLRKQKCSVNYVGDENSSICSDNFVIRSVNRMVRRDLYSSDEGFHEGARSKRCSESNDDTEVDYFEESILTQSSGQVYLLDYGLASKFVNSDGTHKEFGMDQRKAHDGTLEYSSRDSHIGAHSRRSDLENLGFNILDWLTGGLPWKSTEIMDNPDLVHAVKKNYMKDTKRFLEACFKTPAYPSFVEKYIDYVNNLEFTEKPDYAYCKSLFVNEFVSCNFGTVGDMMLNFGSEVNVFPQKKKNYSKKIGRNKTVKNTAPDFLRRNGVVKPLGRENFIMNSWENGLKMDLLREGLNLSNDGNRKPCASRNFYVSDAVLISKLRQSLLPILETPSKKFSPKNLRSKKIISKKCKGTKNKRSSIGKFGNFLGSGKQYTWAEILAGNPENIIRKVDKEKTCEASAEMKNPRSRKVSNASEVSLPSDVNASPNLLRKDFLSDRNPTYAMKQVVAQYRRKITGKHSVKLDFDELDGDSNETGYTYAMIMVLRNKEKRLKKEKEELAATLSELPRTCKSKKLKLNRSVKSIKSTNQKCIRNPSPKTLISPRNNSLDEKDINKNLHIDNIKNKVARVRLVRYKAGGEVVKKVSNSLKKVSDSAKKVCGRNVGDTVSVVRRLGVTKAKANSLVAQVRLRKVSSPVRQLRQRAQMNKKAEEVEKKTEPVKTKITAKRKLTWSVHFAFYWHFN